MCNARPPQPQPASTTESALPSRSLRHTCSILANLRLIQGCLRGRIVGTGVCHRLTEPQRVEIVADVIVPVDVVARTCESIAAGSAQSVGDSARDGIAGFGTSEDLEERHHEFDQIALDLDLPGAVGVAKSNLRVAQQSEQRSAVGDPHVLGRYRRLAALRARRSTAAETRWAGFPACSAAGAAGEPRASRPFGQAPPPPGPREMQIREAAVKRCSWSRQMPISTLISISVPPFSADGFQG